MWVIRTYNPTDDELAREYPLENATLHEIEALLGFAPTKLGSTELTKDQWITLAAKYPIWADPGLAYFLDFDADPQPVGRKRRPTTATAR
jgi:hypothetical protein